MIIAVVADIHGNLPALQAVYAHALDHGVQQVWNLGDSVGYGPFPNEVVTWLRETAAADIVGNYDLKVLRTPQKLEKWKTTKLPEKWHAFQWAYENLSEENRNYLYRLPEQLTIALDSYTFRLVHGSPASIKEHLTSSTSISRFVELAKIVEQSIILCGHSHRMFFRIASRKLFLNPGSVGRPDDGDNRSTYAIISINEEDNTGIFQDAIQKGWFQACSGETVCRFGLYRVGYSVEKTIEAVREHGLPEDYAQMFLQGLNIDIIQSKGKATVRTKQDRIADSNENSKRS